MPLSGVLESALFEVVGRAKAPDAKRMFWCTMDQLFFFGSLL